MTTTEIFNSIYFQKEADVTSFIKLLSSLLGIGFHPDTAFADYIDHYTKKPIFSEKEATILENKISQCREVCEQTGIDIYEIALYFTTDLMNLNAWVATKTILTDRKDMRSFYKNIQVQASTDLISIHVYAANRYIIQPLPDLYCVDIENTSFTGTLTECERVLFDWQNDGI